MDVIHHIGLPCSNIEETSQWYCNNFNCSILYKDHDWCMIQFGNIQLALVNPEKHSTHIAFEHLLPNMFGITKKHRDGSVSAYNKDPAGNTIEYVKIREKRG